MKLIDTHNRSLRKLDDYSKGVSLPKKILDKEIENESDGKTTILIKTYRKDNGNIVFEATVNSESAGSDGVGKCDDDVDGDMSLDEF